MILGLLHFKINGVCLFYNQGINSPPPFSLLILKMYIIQWVLNHLFLLDLKKKNHSNMSNLGLFILRNMRDKL